MAVTDYGVFSYGLQIPTFEAWQQEYFSLAKTTFGPDVNVNTTSAIGQLLSIPCYQDITIWQMLQSVYDSQTLNGAEGIFLDDILSRRGVFRKPASAGTGFAFIQTNSEAAWTSSIDTNYYFSARNEKNYKVTTTSQYRDRIGAYKLSLTELQNSPVSPIIFYMTNFTTGETRSQSISNNSAGLISLRDFIIENIRTEDQPKVFISADILYVGFSTSNLEDPKGLVSSIYFYASRNIGNKWSLFPVECQVTGVFDLFVGDIIGITPTPPIGYVSVGNFEDFYSGASVETDAEYRARYNATADESISATRPAVYKAVSDLDGVMKVRIYDNPTTTDQIYAPKLTFNTVVLGGVSAEIAQTIYNKKPINSLTSGTVSTTINTEDGGTEVIKYTPAETVSYDIKFRYKKVNGLALTSAEISSIRKSIDELEALFLIGSAIFNAQIEAVIYNNTKFGDIIYLETLTKLSSDPDTNFSTSNIEPQYFQVVNINSDNIVFEQVV
jgi:uncharacterized phage protein gp47/JayE